MWQNKKDMDQKNQAKTKTEQELCSPKAANKSHTEQTCALNGQKLDFMD